MSYIDLTKTTAPSTPATNHVEVYVDTADKHLKTIDDVGTISDLVGVTSTHADANANITGAVQLVSGTNVTLSQASQAITIKANISTASFTASTDSPITPDASTTVTVLADVDAALTVNGPTGAVDGQKITFRLFQSGSGFAVTFSTGSGNFRFGTDIPSFTASGAGLTDYVGAIWNNGATRWDIVSVIQGF